jgi:hypothetical protein
MEPMNGVQAMVIIEELQKINHALGVIFWVGLALWFLNGFFWPFRGPK